MVDLDLDRRKILKFIGLGTVITVGGLLFLERNGILTFLGKSSQSGSTSSSNTGLTTETTTSTGLSTTKTLTTTKSVTSSSSSSITESLDYQTFFAPNASKVELLRKWCNSPPVLSSGKNGYVKYFSDGKTLFDMIAGDYSCLPPSSLIITAEGPRPIESIKIGALVYTHKGRFRKVTNTFERDYKGDLISIKVWGAIDALKLTPEHNVFSSFILRPKTWRNEKIETRLSSITWLEAQDVEVNSFLMFPVLNNDTKPRTEILVERIAEYIDGNGKQRRDSWWSRNFPINKDLMTIIGYYLAEGYEGFKYKTPRPHRKKVYGHVHFSFGKSLIEHQYASEVIEAAKNLGFNSRLDLNQYGIKVTVFSTLLMSFIKEHFGVYSYGKHLPNWIYDCPKELLEELLRTYLNGDGHKASQIHWSVSSISRELIEDMRLVSLKLGYRTDIHLHGNKNATDTIQGRTVKIRQSYTLLIKEHNKDSNCGRGSPKTSDLQFLRVRSVERLPYDGKVYNLEVEEDNSYVTTSGIVHNCLSCSSGIVLGNTVTVMDPGLIIAVTLAYLNRLADDGTSQTIDVSTRDYFQLGQSFVQGYCIKGSENFTYQADDRREVLFGKSGYGLAPNGIPKIAGPGGTYQYVEGHLPDPNMPCAGHFNSLTEQYEPSIGCESISNKPLDPSNLNNMEQVCVVALNAHLQGDEALARSTFYSVLSDWQNSSADGGYTFPSYTGTGPDGTPDVGRCLGNFVLMFRALENPLDLFNDSNALSIAVAADQALWSLQDTSGDTNNGGIYQGYPSMRGIGKTGGEDAGYRLLSADPRLPSWF